MSGTIKSLIGIFTLRLLTLIPLILDEDEAWFSVSAASLHSPFDFFAKTIDNKPPGTVWYFWLIQNLFHAGMDPRVARFGYIICTFFTAFLIWKIACHFNKSSAWTAPILFLLASAAPYPKMLATTTEGLMLPLICGTMLYLLEGNTAIAGILFCLTILMKQTAILFIFPIFYLLYQRKKWIHVFYFVIACAVFLSFFLYHLNINDFWYWNYTYPKNILEKVRSDLFSLWFNFGMHILILAFLLWPLTKSLLKRASTVSRTDWIRSLKKENTFLILWTLSGFISLFITKGLFFHYFLLLLPPVCILIADEKLSWRWLWSSYFVICILSALPALQTFWGVDLLYYQKLGKLVQNYTKPNEKIFIWGGNAVAHITSSRPSIEKFITTRFAAPPYSTPSLEKEFEEKFLKEKPQMLVDLHERGDNRFNYPLSIYPWLNEELKKSYFSFQTPALPWAIFYIKTSQTTSIPETQISQLLPFDKLYVELWNKVRVNPFKYLNHFFQIESCLRLWEGLRSMAENHKSSTIDPQFLDLHHDLQITIVETLPFSNKVLEYQQRFFSLLQKYHLPLPMAVDSSFMWWVSFALVKLQPVAKKS